MGAAEWQTVKHLVAVNEQSVPEGQLMWQLVSSQHLSGRSRCSEGCARAPSCCTRSEAACMSPWISAALCSWDSRAACRGTGALRGKKAEAAAAARWPADTPCTGGGGSRRAYA